MKRFFVIKSLAISLLLCISLGCFACDGLDSSDDKTGHTCTFNVQAVKEEYKLSDASCTEKAKYFYSCSCGLKGEATFEYGDALGHDYSAVSNENGTHTKTCSRDASHVVTEDCSGGVATETNKPICDVCKTEYGATLGHEHVFDKQRCEERYLKTSAQCGNKALYFYSCSCG